MKSESEEVKKLMFTTRALLIMSWGFYPIAYILPSLFNGSTVIVVTQVGYTVADVIAKPLWTYFIYKISKAKQDDEEVASFSEKTLKAA